MNIKTLGAMAKFKRGVTKKRPEKGQEMKSGSAFASLAQKKFSSVAKQVIQNNDGKRDYPISNIKACPLPV